MLLCFAAVDLQYNLTVGNVSHDTKIDWLELNESGTKLLFRDKRARLYLYDVDSSNKLPLVMSCEFVQVFQKIILGIKNYAPGSQILMFS